MSDEPSNFALSLSERIQAGEAFDLSQGDLGRLTVYERMVLQRTAERLDYVFTYNMDTGIVSLKKDYGR